MNPCSVLKITRCKMEESKDIFFVGIKDPVLFRKEILESSKESIKLLQEYEKLKTIREEKTKNVLKLNGLMKEIEKLVIQLKNVLPKVEMRIKNDDAGAEYALPKIKEHKKTVSEVDKLERELGMIESKLNSLIG